MPWWQIVNSFKSLTHHPSQHPSHHSNTPLNRTNPRNQTDVHVHPHRTTGRHSSTLQNPAFPHLQNRRSVGIVMMIFIVDLGFFDVPAGG